MLDLFLISKDTVVQRSIAKNLKVMMPYIATFLPEEEQTPDQSPASLSSDTFSKQTELLSKGFKMNGKPLRKHSNISAGGNSAESVSEESSSESSYQALLPKLVVFENSIKGYTFWREHCIFLETMAEFIDRFNVPKALEALGPRIA